MWGRLVKSDLVFPWNLALLVNEETDRHIKSEVAKAFFETKKSCLDEGFSRPLHDKITSPEDLLPGGAFWNVLKAGFQGNMCNIACENAFARLKTMTKTNRGRRDLLTTLCSKHLVSEAKAAHLINIQNVNLESTMPEQNECCSAAY